MAVITLTEANTFLGITGTASDALITALIPEIQGFIVSHCRYTFLDENGAESWPAGMKLTASKMIGWNMQTISNTGMKSESQGGYSYTKDSASGMAYPPEILAALNLQRRASLKGGQVMSQSFDRRGLDAHELAEGEYVAGIENLPLED